MTSKLSIRDYIAFGVLLLIVAFIGIAFQRPSSVGASIDGEAGYTATTTSAIAEGHIQIKSGYGMLGSIVVASSSATTFKVWNATSTTDVASTSITNFVASPANGTYTYDVNLSRGIIVELPTGFNGAYTITYK